MKLGSDTVAYLTEAAIALAQVEGIDTRDRPQFEAWVSQNMSQIATTAMDRQLSTLQTFFDHRADIQTVMAERVHSILQ